MKKNFDFNNFMTVEPYSEENIKWFNVTDEVFALYGTTELTDNVAHRFSENEITDVEKVSKDVAFLAKCPAGVHLKFKTNRYGTTELTDNVAHRFSENEITDVEKVSKDVAFLAKCPAGVHLKFKTNSKRLMIDALLPEPPNMCHMTALGQCGFDLYVFDDTENRYVLHSNTVFNVKNNYYQMQLLFFQDDKERDYILYFPLYMNLDDTENRYVLHSNTVFNVKNNYYQMQLLFFQDDKERDYILYFPLYMNLSSVRIGFDDNATVSPSYYKNDKRILLYGTSIAQGGCVSRPGMLYTSILSRTLDREILNYGFSGAALGEKEVALILAKRKNIELLIIDIQANAGCSEKLENNLEEFIVQYNTINPNVKILVITQIPFAMDLYIIDIQANAGCSEKLENNLEEFIVQYNTINPNVKILVITQIPFAMDLYDEKRTELKLYYKYFMKRVVDKFRKKGIKIYFLDGDNFFTSTQLLHFTEYTVDGVHPTDLGSSLIAEGYYKKIVKVLDNE